MFKLNYLPVLSYRWKWEMILVMSFEFYCLQFGLLTWVHFRQKVYQYHQSMEWNENSCWYKITISELERAISKSYCLHGIFLFYPFDSMSVCAICIHFKLNQCDDSLLLRKWIITLIILYKFVCRRICAQAIPYCVFDCMSSNINHHNNNHLNEKCSNIPYLCVVKSKCYCHRVQNW